MADNTTTLIGNLTRDPELRFTPNGVAVANFGLAVTFRKKVGDDWEDVPNFFDVSCWRELAENVSETFAKGNRVIVVGRLEQRSWEDDDGNKRSKVEIVADEVGPSLRWATATITRNERKEANGNGRSTSRPVARSASRSRDEREF